MTIKVVFVGGVQLVTIDRLGITCFIIYSTYTIIFMNNSH